MKLRLSVGVKILPPRARRLNPVSVPVESPHGQLMVKKTLILTKVARLILMGLVRPIRGGKLIWVVNTRLMKWKSGIAKAMSPDLMDSLSNYWTPTGSRFTRVEKPKVHSGSNLL